MCAIDVHHRPCSLMLCSSFFFPCLCTTIMDSRVCPESFLCLLHFFQLNFLNTSTKIYDAYTLSAFKYSFYASVSKSSNGELRQSFLPAAYPSDCILLCIHHAIRATYQESFILVLSILCINLCSAYFLCYQKEDTYKYNPFLHFAYAVVIIFVEQNRSCTRTLLKHIFFFWFFVFNFGTHVPELILYRLAL